MSSSPNSEPDKLREHVERASHLIDLKRYEQAEKTLRQVLAADPAHVYASCRLIDTLSATSRTIEALEVADHALSANPDVPALHRRRGIVLAALGRAEEAAVAFRETIRGQPNAPEGYEGLGRALACLPGGGEEALAVLERAIELAPERACAYMALRLALSTLGRFEEAEEANVTAVALEPTELAWRFSLGCLRIAMGKFKDARQDVLVVLRGRSRRKDIELFSRIIAATPGAMEAMSDIYGQLRTALGSEAK